MFSGYWIVLFKMMLLLFEVLFVCLFVCFRFVLFLPAHSVRGHTWVLMGIMGPGGLLVVFSENLVFSTSIT